jgi:CAAX prenyl protease-like protein
MIQAFVLPFVLYVLGTSAVGQLNVAWYPWGYAAVVAVTMAALIHSVRVCGVLRPHRRVMPGMVVGVVGIVLWIALSRLHLEQHVTSWFPAWMQPAARTAYDPLTQLGGAQAWLFIAIRMVGLAVAVPLAEELFWRGFLLRWLIDPDWQQVPIGRFTPMSCLLVTIFFAAVHPEWLAAALYCLLINGLLYRTKDLWQCVVAHAVSNLLLGIYVVAFREWWLW